jgi:hypothetical protein
MNPDTIFDIDVGEEIALAAEAAELTGTGAPGIGTFTLEIDLPAACSSCLSADWE